MVNRENPHMGPFSSPGPVTIELNEAQDVAQKCKLSDAGALHQALQMWADVYYWTNESQNFEPIKTYLEDHQKVSGTIKKLIAYLSDEKSKAAQSISRHFGQIQLYKSLNDLSNTPGTDATPIYDLEYFLEALGRANELTISDSQRHQQYRRENKRFLQSLPHNPGLKLSIQNMHWFWDAQGHTEPDKNFSDYVPETTGEPGNLATLFVVECAQLIDQDLPEGTIISHMKKHCIEHRKRSS
ncbi:MULTISPECIES: hypothetical protein [unclassified Oceanicaulis]|uniref:hypothetical protein n=1 Tax=unclassified Oceanicaulis TaxID=2632123 RepID=UPI0025F5D0E2|nr:MULTISPECIES: hypothetical protein [unclassified Oceanicaulis]|tara:strand:- start:253 stop:975 length:723 start_codon:yes stop_codon:yes gene_type:complete